MDPNTLPNEVWAGIFIPLVIAVIQQWHWSKPVRAMVGFISCVVAATLMNAAHLTDMKSLLASMATILTMSGVFYRAYWLPSGITSAIDERTTFTTVKPGDIVHPDAAIPTPVAVIASNATADDINA